MKKSNFGFAISILIGLLVGALPIAATTLDITTTDFVSGGQIKSGTFLTMSSEIESWANGNVGTDNISDSGLTYNFFGAKSINSGHIANVGANTLDSGAINSDSMIAFNTISTLKIISSTDTQQNWRKQANGLYIGNGDDTRYIWNTNMSGDSVSGYMWTGDTINFHITRVEIWYAGTGTANPWLITDIMQDSGCFAPTATTIAWVGEATGAIFGPGWDASGNLKPAFVYTADSSAFIINNNSDAAGGTLNPNNTEYVYYWTATGY